jgi:hypothetical protein
MMPTNVLHAGCVTELAGDTTTARSYRTSFAERERLHLRQEFYLGRRAFKLNSTVTTRKPHKWMTYKSEKVVDRARMRRDPTHFIPRTDRRPWAQRCYWETLKSIRGYDAQKPRTVLAHAWYCWGYWLEVTHIPNKHKRRYAEALVLAWRVLRRWRHWTILAQLLAPTWQQVRLNARLLPPLFTPSGSTPPRTSPTAPRSQEVYRNPWDRKIPLAIWRYGASPWRLTLQEHEEQDPVTSENDCWSSEQDSLLWDFDRLHPGRVWLRSWHTVDCPTSHSHCPTLLWYNFLPSSHADQMYRQDHYSRPPPKFRYVICHYGQPFSWHWIEAAPSFGPMHCFQPHGPATGWQESVLFTTVGSSSGSLTAQVQSFRARSVHPGLFSTTAQVSPAIIQSAEVYRSTTVEVEDFTGAGELTSFTQRNEQTLIAPQSDEELSESDAERSEMYSSDEEVGEDPFVPVSRTWLRNPVCIGSRITWRFWGVLESAWVRWVNLYRDSKERRFTGKVIEDISESDGDLPRTPIRDLWATRDRKALEHAWSHWTEFVAEHRCYSDGRSVDSDWSSIAYDDAHDYFFPDNYLDFDSYFDCLLSCDSVPPPYTRNAWRSDCAITIDSADLNDTWELPSLVESDCAGELELIRYTICTSTMAFEDSAAAAISWERSLSLGSRLVRAHSAFQLASVKDYWENRQGYLRRRHTMKTPPAKFSTKRGRRQHQQELRRARAHRKSQRNDMPRPAQPAVQFRSPFPFAPPTSPSIPLTASKGVFTFSAAARPNPPAHRPENLSTEPRPPGRDTGTRSALTVQSDRPKVRRGPGRCKQNGAILSSELLQPDTLSSSVADTSVDDSDHASAASTVPLLATLLSLIRGLRPDLSQRRRKGRRCKSSWPVPQLPTTDTDLGKQRRKPRKHSPRCTRALMRALGRSRWLNGLCRGLHRGCTDGTGPRPSVEP